MIPDYQQRLLESRGLAPTHHHHHHHHAGVGGKGKKGESEGGGGGGGQIIFSLSPLDTVQNGGMRDKMRSPTSSPPLVNVAGGEEGRKEGEYHTTSFTAAEYVKESRSPLAKKIAAILEARR
mmetsp:Transcript_26113/g.66300  ORF Transcript_26113/g.66300 Transcript_26113/m.66300 type:complete len:122 (-) Transcript_26113:1378-1743(-)